MTFWGIGETVETIQKFAHPEEHHKASLASFLQIIKNVNIHDLKPKL